jgi:hypothetical protein
MADRINNLRPFKPGQSGNVKGRPSLPPELRCVRREKMVDLIKLVHTLAGMTGEQARVQLSKTSNIQIEEMVLEQITKAKHGDTNAFKLIINIMCGKLPESDEPPNHTESMTTEEKLAFLKQGVEALECQLKVENKSVSSNSPIHRG